MRHLTLGQTLSIKRNGGLTEVAKLHRAKADRRGLGGREGVVAARVSCLCPDVAGRRAEPAVLEAMGHARPVLLTRTCFFEEAAAVGAGLECASDRHSIAAALRELATMPQSQLEAMGRRGRELVTAKHDLHQVARQLDASLAGVLAAR